MDDAGLHHVEGLPDGLHIEGQPDGSARIIAVAGGRKVKLTVSGELARRYAARLLVASAPWIEDDPSQADAVVSSYLRIARKETCDDA